MLLIANQSTDLKLQRKIEFLLAVGCLKQSNI